MDSKLATLRNCSVHLVRMENLRRNDGVKTIRTNDPLEKQDDEVERSSVSSAGTDSIDRSQDLLARCPHRRNAVSVQKNLRPHAAKRQTSRFTDSNESRASSTQLEHSNEPQLRKKSKKPLNSEHPAGCKRAESSSYESSSDRVDSGVESNYVVPEPRESRTTEKHTDGDNRGKLNMVLRVLKHFKDPSIAGQYARTMRWAGTMENTAVDTIVKLADALDGDEETAKLCIRAAIDTIETVHELILDAVAKQAFDDPLWTSWLSIILTLCDSSAICEKIVCVFMSKLTTVKFLPNCDEPEDVSQQLEAIDRARFALNALTETLKKYATIQEKRSRETKKDRRCGQIDDRDVQWSQTLSIYASQHLDSFPWLSETAWNAVELLRNNSTLHN